MAVASATAIFFSTDNLFSVFILVGDLVAILIGAATKIDPSFKWKF